MKGVRKRCCGMWGWGDGFQAATNGMEAVNLCREGICEQEPECRQSTAPPDRVERHYDIYYRAGWATALGQEQNHGN